MEKIDFAVGYAKKIFQFMSNINYEDKIALISHTDLDGIASAKIVSEVLEADYIELVNYEELTFDLINKLKKQNIRKLILTDLMVDDLDFIKTASKFFDILWIDHHVIREDVNSNKIIYLNPGGNNKHCATYLCYYLFEKIKNLEDYDWLVACACLSDFTIKENKEWLEKVFRKYSDKTEIKPMSEENGPIQNAKRILEFAIIYFKTNNDLKQLFDLIKKEPGSIKEIEKYAKEVSGEVNFFVNKFEKEKKEINNRYVFEFEPRFQIGALVSNTISVRNPTKTIIMLRTEKSFFAVSMRRQNSEEDMNALMKNVLSGLENAGGGGHIPAAGGHFMKKDKEKFIERLKKI